nr:MAG TPA: hypothetical protein [Caudoviricetes sp.]
MVLCFVEIILSQELVIVKNFFLVGCFCGLFLTCLYFIICLHDCQHVFMILL